MWLSIFVLLGALTSIFVGLAISAIAKSQASVNAIGMTLFLFFQLIPNLQKSSDTIKSIAIFIPSTYINSGIQKSMFMQISKVGISHDLCIASVAMVLSYLIAHILLKSKQIEN